MLLFSKTSTEIHQKIRIEYIGNSSIICYTVSVVFHCFIYFEAYDGPRSKSFLRRKPVMKRTLSLSVAVLMLLMIVAALAPAITAESVRTPNGYADNEYEQLRAFFEQTNADGVKNGTQLSPTYDPDDPTTWGGIMWCSAPTGLIQVEYISFSSYYYQDRNLVGELNISGFSTLRALGCAKNSLTSVTVTDCALLDELDAGENLLTSFTVSDCPALRLLWCNQNDLTGVELTNLPILRQFHCYSNPITELDVSEFPNLYYLYCYETELTSLNVRSNHEMREIRCNNTLISELDVSECSHLTDIFCFGTNITELDISNNSDLVRLFCNDTDISELDLTNNTKIDKLRCYNTKITELDWNCIVPGLSLDINISTEGSGYVGVDWIRDYVNGTWENQIFAVATANGAQAFLGWYDAAGGLVSSEPRLCLGIDINVPATTLVARFEEADPNPGLLGDVNNNGIVEAEDALLVLRHSMNIYQLSDNQLPRADMNGDGTINFDDAVLIIRNALDI